MTQYYITAHGGPDDVLTELRIMRSDEAPGKNGYARTDRDVVIDHYDVHRAKVADELRKLRARVDYMNAAVR